jgi:GNAT superfamily N-acetyltransferase
MKRAGTASSKKRSPKVRIVQESRVAATSKAVIKGLVAYNDAQAGKAKWKRHALSARDITDAIRGGIVVVTHWNWGFIELLWVDERLRGTGIGAQLIAAGEALAKRRGAQHIYVDTFSFQGDGFYQRLGYEVYGALDDFPPGHRRLWLKKDLT